MDTVTPPTGEPKRDARPLTGWAAAAALAITALAALGVLWLLRRSPPAAGRQPITAMRLDLNSAGAAELRLLPGIGTERSEKLVRARQSRGGFRSLKELDEPALLGPGAAERLKPFLQPLPGD